MAGHHPDFENDWLLRHGRRWVDFYMRGVHEIQRIGPCTLPSSGPAILVCNHISGLDPAILQWASTRMVTWLMAAEYYEQIGLRWLFRKLNCVPVQRTGQDLSATRVAMRALKQGRVVGIFPEGRISTEAHLLPFQTGVTLMALRTGAPVCPAAIEGTMRNESMVQAYMRSQRGRVIFGPLLRLDPDANIETNTLEIHAAVRQIWQKLRFENAGLANKQN